ncbi:Metallo-hydrolase/oxidoreductase [Aureobasidium subglaciale]|nr:Metallo-hydrolase/oxidoreductase [Aureobasidium subglaciale]
MPPIDIPDLSSLYLEVYTTDRRRTSGTALDVPAGTFIKPVYKGSERFHYPAFVYLLKHSSGNVLFDMGIRKDWTNLPPHKVESAQKNGWNVTTGENMADILAEHGVDIKAVIWSHPHLDHVGDMSTFSKDTTLVTGRNFETDFMPGYPHNPSSGFWDSDYVREDGLKIGDFDAHDYFGDGSFYLLDTPGHMKSHMCGLARMSSEPFKFVFMGGDIAHHAGQLRPSKYRSLPTIRPQLRVVDSGGADDEETQRTAEYEAKMPFYRPSPGVHHDIEALETSLDSVRRFDADDRVLILLAHDESLRRRLDFFPNSLSKCFDKATHDEIRWGFLELP